jgi:selenocysteine lyase/cysteine desulfurase
MNRSLPNMQSKTGLEDYFSSFRKNIIGIHQTFQSPFGIKKIVYADWTAAGRAYRPIEECIHKEILPWLANTHSETTITGTLMSQAYTEAKSIVKAHANASKEDMLVFCGSGMTAAVNKLQRILGLRIPERIADYLDKYHCDSGFLHLDEELRPVVFVTHMEHHSNQLSWLETIADVEIIGRNEHGNVDLRHFRFLLEKFRERKNKLAAVTACSNVTGIQTPYHEIAKLIHAYGGLCFVDFACSAPYCNINMHPGEASSDLDAIYFSFHKFLGGPATPGVLIFNQNLYRNSIPDQPGGGTVIYSNPWRGREYTQDVEQREDGGTPPFLQGMKAAMCVRLKEKMGVANMLAREEEILKIIFPRMLSMKNVEVLESNINKRIGVISFLVKGAHYNLIAKLLNDRFGIQTRGGCSCAGTYGHTLLEIDQNHSFELLKSIRAGDLSCKPGWVRLSIHPTMTNAEINNIMDAVEETVDNFRDWGKDYTYVPHLNEYTFKRSQPKEENKIVDWFNPGRWNNYLGASDQSDMHKRV